MGEVHRAHDANRGPVWAGAGRELLFMRDNQLVVVNLDGQGLSPQPSASTHYNIDLNWFEELRRKRLTR